MDVITYSCFKICGGSVIVDDPGWKACLPMPWLWRRYVINREHIDSASLAISNLHRSGIVTSSFLTHKNGNKYIFVPYWNNSAYLGLTGGVAGLFHCNASGNMHYRLGIYCVDENEKKHLHSQTPKNDLYFPWKCRRFRCVLFGCDCIHLWVPSRLM